MLSRDLVFAARFLRKSPGFVAAAILTMALGVGANTAIFSAIDEILLRPLPVPQGDRLAAVYRLNQKTSKYLSASYPGYEELRDGSRSFAALSAYARLQFNLRVGDHAERVPVEAVSSNYFDMMQLPAVAGRTLREGDGAAVMLGEDLWRGRFQADPSLIGRTVALDGRLFQIVGIVPRAFHGPNMNWGDPPQGWIPISVTPVLIPAFSSADALHQRAIEWLLLVGRLNPGVTVARTQAELRTLARDRDVTLAVFPASNAKFWPAYRESLGGWLKIFSCAAGLVLLLACANLSNLLLERGLGRRREIAIRLALGGGRSHIVRQLLTENVLIAIPGFGASLLVAKALQQVLLHFPNAFGMALAMDLSLETRVLLFCFALSVAAAALFGIVPAVAATRRDTLPALKESGNPTPASAQLNDPRATEWGRLRASNGHPEPYGVRHFQIDNEPMNNGFTPEKYSEIVNAYGSRLRAIAPEARIVACGQKRSNDMVWSQKVVDLAGKNFDVLGVHNYEYEPENFESGLRRIRDYLWKLRDYVRASAHPQIEIGVLEWNLSRTYDWRAGLHAAGSLILYEELSPSLAMSCPALLMRNTTDDPTWTSFIYHDHVSWFPGSAYPVEKLFREHYADRYLASTSGSFRDVADRKRLFEEISTMRPDDWMPGTVDAIATGSADGRRIVIKAVNYGAEGTALLVRQRGASVPGKAVATLHTISAGLKDSASLDHPDAIAPVSRTLAYATDLTVDLDPYTVAVLEIRAE